MKKNPTYVKLIFIFLLTALLLSGCRPKAVRIRKKENDISLAKILVKKEFIIGVTDDYPPLSFKNLFTAKVEGYDIEIAQEVCKRMNVKPIFKTIEWDKRDELLNNGNIDCVWSAFAYNQERDETYELTFPYIKTAIILVVKNTSPYYSIKDIREKRIGVPASSFIQTSLKKAEAIYGNFSNIIVFQNAQDIFNALEKDEIECIAYDLLSINVIIKAKTSSYRVIDEPIASEDYVIAFKKGNKALMHAVETNLQEMAKTDFLEKASKKWFNANISIIGR